MARQSSSGSGSTSFLRGLLARLWKRPELKSASRRTRRRMFMEQLDTRAVLASDLGAIGGLVYVDADQDGNFDFAERVQGATINLYQDDGDGVFEPGAGVGLDGAPFRTTTTDANGEYIFEDLGAGDYWVHQIAQFISPNTLLSVNSDLITIDATQEQGVSGTLIDSFVSAVPTAVASDPLNSTNSATADLLDTEVLGTERDFKVQLTATGGGDSVTLTVSADKIRMNPTAQAQGRYTATWDGNDGDGDAIDFDGLYSAGIGYDLTDAGNSAGIVLEDLLVDQAGGSVTIRVYTDATNFSTLTLPLTASTTTDLFFKFSSFTTGGGTGADFTEVGAIQLEMNSTVNAMDGEIELIEAIGYNLQTFDFDNFFESDLSLTKDVDNATPNVGDNVTFTIVVTNAGPDAAQNVTVQDLLPAGLTFVSKNPEAGTTYDETTGVWTIGTIPNGGDVTLVVVATAATAGAKTNTARVEASASFDPDSTPGNATAEDDLESVIVTPQQIDLSLTKTPVPTNLAVGSNVTFTLTVTNAAGASNATGVVVEDLLPAGLTFVSKAPSAGTTYDEVTGIWTVGALNAGANATLSIVATKTAAGAIVNNAEVTAADQPDVDSTPDNSGTAPNEDDTAAATVNDVPIDLSLTKTPTTSNVAVGSNVTFTITVTNAVGAGNATGVIVEDLLPAGLTFVSKNPSSGTTYDEVTGIWNVGALNAGANATLSIVATKTAVGAIVNNAEVTDADQQDVDSTPDNSGTAPNEDDTAAATVNDQTIDLQLTKTVAGTQNVGQNVTFTLTLSNVGLGNATGVVVRDLLPAGLTFVSKNPSAGTTYDEVTGLWTVGAVNAAANATLQIVATIATPGAKTNTAQVTAAVQPDVDSTPNNIGTAPNEDDTASVTVTPASIDLSIDKTVNNATPNVGQNVVFTVIVSNLTGVSNATGVVVRDLLPAGLTFVSSTQTVGTYASGTGLWTVGNLNAGSSATLTITATVASVGAKTNLAEVSAADQADADSTVNNSGTAPTEDDTDSVVVTPQSIDLQLAKTVNNATPNKNQNVTFTVTVNNVGTNNATGVAVTDLLPAGFTFVSSTPSIGTYNSTTGVWTVGTVNAAASATLSIVATVTTVGQKTNTAQVTAADQADIDSTPNNIGTAPNEDDTASVNVTPAVADLSLTKTVNDTTPDRNQQVTYTLTLTNGGPQTATNVTVTDLLPAGMTFVSSTPGGGSTYNQSTGVWTIPTLNSGANVVLTVVATTTTAGAKTNTAEVTASDQFDSDSTPGNRATAPTEDDTASATVTPTATDLAVTKTVDDTTPEIGQNVTFTITVSNTSATNATNVVLTDLLPSGLTFVSSNPSQGTYVSSTGLWTIGTINANSAVTLTVVATVANNSTKVNAAEITSLDQFDSDSTPNNGGTTEDDRAVVTLQPFILSKRNSVVR